MAIWWWLEKEALFPLKCSLAGSALHHHEHDCRRLDWWLGVHSGKKGSTPSTTRLRDPQSLNISISSSTVKTISQFYNYILQLVIFFTRSFFQENLSLSLMVKINKFWYWFDIILFRFFQWFQLAPWLSVRGMHCAHGQLNSIKPYTGLWNTWEKCLRKVLSKILIPDTTSRQRHTKFTLQICVGWGQEPFREPLRLSCSYLLVGRAPTHAEWRSYHTDPAGGSGGVSSW